MGKPRTPTNILAMRGAFDKDPARGHARDGEPSVDDVGEIGEPPAHFDEQKRECWYEIIGNTAAGVLIKSDRLALEIASELMAAKRAAPGGLLHPSLLIRLTALLGAFGMTPADRSKVTAPKKAPENPFAKLVAKGDAA